MPQQQRIDRNKYHKKSIISVIWENFVKSAGRQYPNPKQALEAGALRWHTISPDEQEAKKKETRAKIKATDVDLVNNPYMVRNGSLRDGEHDPDSLGRLCDLMLKDENDVKRLKQVWDWRADDDLDIHSWHFFIICVDADITQQPQYQIKHRAVAVVEFTLSKIVDEYFHVVRGGENVAESDQMGAFVDRIFDSAKLCGRNVNDESLPIFFTSQDQYAAVFDILTCTKSERNAQLSFLNHLSSTTNLARALGQFLQVDVGAGCQVIDEAHCMEKAHEMAESIMGQFWKL